MGTTHEWFLWSRTRTDDASCGCGPGVYRVGQVVDGRGVVTEAEQRKKRSKAGMFGALGYVLWRIVYWIGYYLGVIVWAVLSGVAFLTWKGIYVAAWAANGLSGKVVELMEDYEATRETVMQLPTDTAEETPKQIEAEVTPLRSLPKNPTPKLAAVASK